MTRKYRIHQPEVTNKIREILICDKHKGALFGMIIEEIDSNDAYTCCVCASLKKILEAAK